jgi:hypothetical protein
MKIDLFKEVIPSILTTKKNPFKDENDYKDYTPFVVNRALSYHVDCILYANEMNLYPELDKDMQYLFYLNIIRGMKRKFQPWQKAEVNKDIDSIKEYFGYSNEKARDALKVLTPEQVAIIKDKTNKGGIKK